MRDIVWIPLFDGVSETSVWRPALRRKIENLKPKDRPYFEDEPPNGASRWEGWEYIIDQLRALPRPETAP